MAAPHIIPLSKVGFNSKTRTVENLALPTPIIDVYNETNQAPMAGMLPPLAGGQRQPLSFTTRFNPSGSAAGAKTPPDGVLFKSAALKETISTTVSTTYDYTGALATDFTAVAISASIGNALKFALVDAASGLTMRAVAGQPILLDWTPEGKYTAVTEAAITDALANGGAAPVCVNSTTTINGKTPVMRSWTIALNNTLEARPDLLAATGYQASRIVSQIPTLELLIECPDFSTANYWADLLAAGNTLHAFSSVVGTGAGFVITTTGKFYLTAVNSVALGAGILGLRLSYRMDTVTGSPLSIALT